MHPFALPAVSTRVPYAPPVSSSPVLLGRTRCYWAILSRSLQFVYLDPILHDHLGGEVPLFLSCNLLDFVHPDEVASLKLDLLPVEGVVSGVEAAGVFGSVTRCRYGRIPYIRKLLGNDSAPMGIDAEKYEWMQDFLDLRITTSWIGSNQDGTGGAVLAFFHGIEDKDPNADNDFLSRSAWTNWCGPRVKDGMYLDPYRCAQLGTTLANEMRSQYINIPQYNSGFRSASPSPPVHVFQILDHTGSIIFTFPDSMGRHGEVLYDPESYADLAREVVARPRGLVDATTSCTRRYRSKHPVIRGGTLATVESVVIMYGAITFICCQTGGVFLSSAARISRSTMPPSLSAGAFDLEDVPTRARDEATHYKRASGGLGFQEEEFDYKRRRFDEPPPEPAHYQPAPPMLPIFPFLGYPHRADFQRGPVSGETSPSIVASSILGSLLSTSLPHMQQRDRPYEFNGQNYATDSSGSNASSPGLAPATMGYYPPPLSSYATSYAYAPAHPLSQSASFGPVPIPNRIVPSPLPSYAAPPSAPVEVVARIAEIKEEKRLPRRKAAPTDLKTGGVKACLSCGSVNSPEWRKGSDGTKSLCNACGLRYARSIARQNKAAETSAAPSPPVEASRQASTSRSDSQGPSAQQSPYPLDRPSTQPPSHIIDPMPHAMLPSTQYHVPSLAVPVLNPTATELLSGPSYAPYQQQHPHRAHHSSSFQHYPPADLDFQYLLEPEEPTPRPSFQEQLSYPPTRSTSFPNYPPPSRGDGRQ